MNSELGALALIEQNGLTEISELRADRILSISRLIDEYTNMIKVSQLYAKLDAAEPVNEALMQKLNLAVSRSDSIAKDQYISQGYLDIANLVEISETEISNLVRAADLISTIDKLCNMQRVYDTSVAKEVTNDQIFVVNNSESAMALIQKIADDSTGLDQINNYIDQVESWFKQIGVATTTCPKCGEDVIIDTDLIKG